jgi:Uma2 family endonuclease
MTAVASHTNRVKVPPFLIYETMDGKALYYSEFKKVLNKKQSLESIMGASGLQSVIISHLLRLLFRGLDEKKYFFATGESGVHIDHQNNLANDIAIYSRNVLIANKINTKYIDVSAELVIEIDVKIDLANAQEADYIQTKTQKLLDFGTQKVVWVFTNTKKIMVATAHENWQIMNWSKDVLLIENVTANIGEYLNSEGILL